MNAFNRLTRPFLLLLTISIFCLVGASDKKPSQKNELVKEAIEHHIANYSTLVKSAFEHIKYAPSEEQFKQLLHQKNKEGGALLCDMLLYPSKPITVFKTSEEFLKTIGSLASLLYSETIGLYQLRQLLVTINSMKSEEPGFNYRFDPALLGNPSYSIYDPYGRLTKFFIKNSANALVKFKSAETFISTPSLFDKTYAFSFGTTFIKKPCAEFGQFVGFKLSFDQKGKYVNLQLCTKSGKKGSVKTILGGLHGLLRAELISQPQILSDTAPHKAEIEARNALLRLLITLRDYLFYVQVPALKNVRCHNTCATTFISPKGEDDLALLHGLLMAIADQNLAACADYIIDPLVGGYVTKVWGLCKLYAETYTKTLKKLPKDLKEGKNKVEPQNLTLSLVNSFVSALIDINVLSLEQGAASDKQDNKKIFSSSSLVMAKDNEERGTNGIFKLEQLKNMLSNFCDGFLFDYHKDAFALALQEVVKAPEKVVKEQELIIKNEELKENINQNAENSLEEVIELKKPEQPVKEELQLTIVKKDKNAEVENQYLNAIEVHLKKIARGGSDTYFLDELAKSLVGDKELFKQSQTQSISDTLNYDLEEKRNKLKLAFKNVICKLGSLADEVKKAPLASAEGFFLAQNLKKLNEELATVNKTLVEACVKLAATPLSKFCLSGETQRVLGFANESNDSELLEAQLKLAFTALIEKLVLNKADEKLQTLFLSLLKSFKNDKKSTVALPFLNEKQELLITFRKHLAALYEQKSLQELFFKKQADLSLNQENKPAFSSGAKSLLEPFFSEADHKALLVFAMSSGQESIELANLCTRRDSILVLRNTYLSLMSTAQKMLCKTVADANGFGGGGEFLSIFDLPKNESLKSIRDRLFHFLVMRAYNIDKKLQLLSAEDEKKVQEKRINALKDLTLLCEKILSQWSATHVAFVKLLRQWGCIGMCLKPGEPSDNFNCTYIRKACFKQAKARLAEALQSYDNLKVFNQENDHEACELRDTIAKEAFKLLDRIYNDLISGFSTSTSPAHLQLKTESTFKASVLDNYPPFYSVKQFNKALERVGPLEAEKMLRKLLKLHLGEK